MMRRGTDGGIGSNAMKSLGGDDTSSNGSTNAPKQVQNPPTAQTIAGTGTGYDDDVHYPFLVILRWK